MVTFFPLCPRLIIAPNGVAYAPPEARPGILPRLLQEILSTRIMVKAAMKRSPKSAKVWIWRHFPCLLILATPDF